jgi:outer membrane receptor protein involved in Fe transport
MPEPTPAARRLALGAALALALSLGPAFPQANITGVVKGYVTDAHGNFVPGGTVSLRGPGHGTRSRQQVTDGEGYFQFTGLPVGMFTLAAEVLGYQPYEIVDIQINPGETRVFDIVLPEGLTEKVTVTAERHVVDVADTTSREVIDAASVNRLPLIARRYQQILTLFPGVSNDQGFSLAQYHIDGSRITQNGFRLDGATINDHVTGTFGLNVNQNAVERFELNTSGFLPEYGEQSGGIANIVTKSGTNDFEFLYSGFYRSDAFASDIQGVEQTLAVGDPDQDPTNNHTALPETQMWQEIAAGGPIVRDRLWFFSSFQYWQEDKGSIFNDSVSEGDRYHGQFKLTWQASPSNTFVANLATDPAAFTNVITDGRYAEGTNRDQTQGGWFAQFRDTHVARPSLMLESQLFFHHQYLTSRPSQTGLGPFTLTFSNGNPVQFTGTWYNDQDRSTDRIRLSQAVTSQQGAHTLKGGIDYSYLTFSGVNRSEDLLLDFSPLLQDGTGDPGAVYVTTYDYRTPEVTDRAEQEGAVFVQDSWRVNPRLTLQGGIRMDRQTLVGETNVAPRLGFAVDPTGKGKQKIFGNWGKYYDSIFTDFVDFQQADGTIVSYTYVVPSLGVYYYDVPFAQYDYVADGDLSNPVKTAWTLGYEHALPGDVKLGVSTTHWEGENQLRTFLVEDLSLLPPTVGPIDPNATAVVLFDTKGRADYDDYKIYVRKFLSHRFELMGSYTHSRVQGDTSDDFGFEDRTDPEATRYTRLEWDRPDVINFSGTVFLPASFELTGVYRYMSGRLYSPLTATTGDVTIDATYGKNSVRMPPIRTFDLAVARPISVGKTDLKLSLQIYNLTNELNVIDVETLVDAGQTFGSPVAVDQGRIIQMGLEVKF